MEYFITSLILFIFVFYCYCYGKYRYLFNINYKISFFVYNIIIIFIVTSFYYIKGIEDTSKYIDKYQVAVETLKNGIYTDEELNDIETTFFIIDNELYSHIDNEYIKKECPNSKELYYFACYQEKSRISPDHPMCKVYLDKIPDNYNGVLSKEILLEKNIYKAKSLIEKNEKILEKYSQ